MRKNRRGSGPIYAFAIAWLLCALVLPLFKIIGVLVALGLSVATAVIIAKAAGRKAGARTKKEAEAAAAKAEAKEDVSAGAKPESKYPPEVEAVIAEGRIAMKEMGRLYSSIQDTGVRQKINEIMSVSDRIVRDAIDDPSDVPQIQKFLNFYLPTTIKLLNAYDRMSAQGVEGENITGSMNRIEEMLDTTIAAYKKQLDALFANQAADIQTDIEVMNSMLAREGLGGKSYLDIKEFMKEYEKQQKGSTANG